MTHSNDVKYPHSELFTLAEAASNYASRFIKKCYTGVEFQSKYSDKELEKLKKDSLEARPHHLVDINKDTVYEPLQKEVESIKKRDVGQCHEYAVLSLSYLVEILKNRPERDYVAYLVSFEDFDHSFVILDKNPKLKFTKEELGEEWDPDTDFNLIALRNDPFKYLSSEALIIDSWNPQLENRVFLFSEKENKLKGFERIGLSPRVREVAYNENMVMTVTFNSEDAIGSYLKNKQASPGLAPADKKHLSM